MVAWRMRSVAERRLAMEVEAAQLGEARMAADARH